MIDLGGASADLWALPQRFGRHQWWDTFRRKGRCVTHDPINIAMVVDRPFLFVAAGGKRGRCLTKRTQASSHAHLAYSSKTLTLTEACTSLNG